MAGYIGGSSPVAMITDSVTTSSIADNAVTSAKIGVDVIVAEDIASNAITVAELADNAVTNAKIADDAVDSAEIAAGAIDFAHMSVNSINSDQYVDGSIDTAHIANDQITAALMADNSIDSDMYVDSSIDTAHVADGAITAAKIHSAVELGGPSLGTSSVIRTNAQTISENITIPSTSNGMSAGPITIADTYTVTVSGNWTII